MNAGIREGTPVYDASGAELGTVKEVRGDEVKINAPRQPDYWVRVDTLRASGEGRLVLADEVDRYEETAETRTTGAGTQGAHAHAHDTEVRDTGARQTDDETLQLREERLRVGTEREQAGQVELGKRVTERTETAEVPVSEERVVIERRPASGEAVGGEIRDTNETIEVPVERERVRAETETVVTEEVDVRKEAVERTEQVQGTVRKEELEVRGQGDVITEGGQTRRD